MRRCCRATARQPRCAWRGSSRLPRRARRTSGTGTAGAALPSDLLSPASSTCLPGFARGARLMQIHRAAPPRTRLKLACNPCQGGCSSVGRAWKLGVVCYPGHIWVCGLGGRLQDGGEHGGRPGCVWVGGLGGRLRGGGGHGGRPGCVWVGGLGGRLRGGGGHGGRKPVQYIYDGLYIITSVRMAEGKDGFQICRQATRSSRPIFWHILLSACALVVHPASHLIASLAAQLTMERLPAPSVCVLIMYVLSSLQPSFASTDL